MPHAHKHEVNPKTVAYLTMAFAINLLLTIIELMAGIIGNSIALIGDALHNTGDALSILVAIIAYKIGTRKATDRFSFGFKRAETIGSFVNLILLFVSGVYLLYEGIAKIIRPQEVDGGLIIIVSVWALIIDAATAKLSHHDAHHNSNMKMVFLHNLADALGSVGVIVSGLFVLFLGWTFIDGLIAVIIAGYMIAQATLSFSGIVSVLMDAAPTDIDLTAVKKALLKIKGVKDVHHIHMWRIDEHEIGFDCHLVGCDLDLVQSARHVLKKQFDIHHTTIQLESADTCPKCCL